MPSEKRIEARSILHKIADRQPEITMEDGAAVVTESVAIQAMLEFAALTAAEQAEPDPSTLIDTISDEVWNHDASKDNCLVVDRDGLSEPAPAARSGAVKVDELAEEIRRVDGNNSLGAGALAEALMPFLTALEPAEPAPGVEPVRQWPQFIYDSEGEPSTRPPAQEDGR